MKIGIYSPYLDTLGGGERYMISLASHWSESHEVAIYWDSKDIIYEAGKRFDLDVSKINICQNIFSHGSFVHKLLETRKLDLLLVLSDGSVPYSLAKKNIIHLQVPFETLDLGLIKNYIYSRIVFNSRFTLSHTDSRVQHKSLVIYPGVKMLRIGKKVENTILSVGRFEESHTSKKQDVLIRAFIRMQEKVLNHKVKLILAGGLLDRNREYFETLRYMAKNANIEFYPNISFKDLKVLYSESSIYWHAAGFGESEPKRMEHFGISTVEAMSAGCVPIVFNGGGLHEIIRNESEGLLWTTIEQLIQETRQILSHPIPEKSRESIRQRAMDFRDSVFFDAFDRLLLSL